MDDTPAWPPEALEHALRALRGCRANPAAYVPAGGDALVPLRVRPTPRTPCKHALWYFMYTGDVPAAEAALRRVAVAWPDAPEPWCYLGELYLYLGDYTAARRCFETALQRYARTRWAFIGLGAVDLLEGDPAGALERLARGVRVAGAEGPTAWVYRGEALFRTGDLDAARAALEHAVALNPQRVGAWVDLALVHRARGDREALAPVLGRLERHAPGFLMDACACAGVPAWGEVVAAPGDSQESLVAVLEAMLRMLRGNRSSTCVTYFTAGGVLRAVPPPGERTVEEITLDELQSELDRPWV